MPLRIETDAFEDGGIVPPQYGCFGDNHQPGFRFLEPPPAAVSYAMIFHDIDVALDGSVEDGLHWIVWNIPADAGGIPEGRLPQGAVVGQNVERRNAYLGPGAPAGSRYHHYVLELFALRSIDSGFAPPRYRAQVPPLRGSSSASAAPRWASSCRRLPRPTPPSPRCPACCTP